MKKKTFTLVLLLIIFIVQNGQSQSEKWHYYNSASDGQCAISSYIDAAFDNDGNTYALGIKLKMPSVSSFCFMQGDVVVDKFDSLGALVGSYYYDYNNLEEDDTPVAIKRDASTGRIFVLINSHQFTVLVRLTSALVPQWEKRYYDMTPVSLNIGFSSVYVCGNTSDGAVTLRYKSGTGALINYQLYETAQVTDAVLTSTGIVYTGSIYTSTGGDKLIIQKLDSALNLVWSKSYNKYSGNYTDKGLNIKVVNDYIYVGGRCGNSTSSSIGIIYKYQSTGVQSWNKTLPGSALPNDFATFTDLYVDPFNQDCYVLGRKTNDRVYRYSTSGTKLLDSAVIITGTGIISTTFKSITANGSGATQANTVFLAGINAYSNFNIYERCVTYWINAGTGGFIYSDYDQANGGFDPSFGFTMGRLNTRVNPPLYVATGGGRTEANNPQASGSVGIIDCYRITGPLPKTGSLNAENIFSVRPNPAKDEITVTSTVPDGTLEIMDLNGKIMSSYTVQGTQTVIGTNKLQSGFYLIRINNSLGSYTQKLLKAE